MFIIVSDRPPLRDLANFVVLEASARWYNLGLQLLDPRDEGVLHSMKTQTSKFPEEQCTEVFNHWLTTKKNPTWNKLIGSLKSPAVNLPNVASTIEEMLDSRVSYCCSITNIHIHPVTHTRTHAHIVIT